MYCYNRCHGNSARGLRLMDNIYKNVFYNCCHDNGVRDFGPHGIIFVNVL
jgi:hypothetical protein